MGAGALAAGVFGGAVFLLAGRKFSRESCQRGRFALWASLLFLGAFVFRVVLGYYSQGFTTDTDTFKSWANIANTVGFQQIYHEDIFLDYPPGYLYVLVFLEKLRLLLGLPLESQGYTLLIKLPSILADLFCAGVVLHLAKDKLGERAALFLAGAYLFCPAVYLNSAQWGQADSFCAALVLCSVLLLYRERYVPAALLFGVSIAGAAAHNTGQILAAMAVLGSRAPLVYLPPLLLCSLVTGAVTGGASMLLVHRISLPGDIKS
jgi:uncharacterized membrane protein